MQLIVESWEFIGKNTSEIIASCALGITLWQGWIMRRHNKLSVRPHLSIVRNVGSNVPQVSFVLKNDGLGPAIITSYRFFLDNKEVNLNDADKAVSELFTIFEDCFPIGQEVRLNIHAREKNQSFRAGDSQVMLSFGASISESAEFKNVAAMSEGGRIKIQIEYSSLYGKKYTATTSD